MSQTIRVHRLNNGMVLLGESMNWVESAAMSISLPAGYTRDPDNRLGLANLTCEMVQRGCGERNSREVAEALDRLGTERNANVSQVHTNFAAATLADNLSDVLAIHADMVRRPVLPADQLEDGRQVCLHELQSLEDDLAQRTMQAMRARTYPNPWGRTNSGKRDHLQQVTLSDVQNYPHQNYVPKGAIISVAGKIDFERVKDDVERLFGDWEGGEQTPLNESPPAGGYQHIQHDSNQTHIALAYPTVPYCHEDYFRARAAVGALSDGMSSRLFTEVREKRGLCYTIYAVYHSFQNDARVLCYAGTSTDRAQETLDVLVQELNRLVEGVTEHELNRLKARIRSALIMQQEMSTARCGSMVADWYHLQRVRTMEEISQTINALTVPVVNEYIREFPPADFDIVTLGAGPLEVPLGVS